jgi:hypothetical protein
VLIRLRPAAGGGVAFTCDRCAALLADPEQDRLELRVAPMVAGCTEEEAGRYVESQTYTFASTMPETPHYYVLLHNSTDPDTHLRVVNWIRANGEPRPWGRKVHHYWTHGNYEYWAMPPRETILNRRDTRESGPDGRRIAERKPAWTGSSRTGPGILGAVLRTAGGFLRRT